MTARRPDAKVPTPPETKAAATREARGSVHEAIGKLIGDDAARERGRCDQDTEIIAALTAATHPVSTGDFNRSYYGDQRTERPCADR